MNKVVNIPKKLPGQQLSADEVNVTVDGVNEAGVLAVLPAYSLHDGSFIIDGFEVIDGKNVPVVKINPAVFTNNRIILDPTQFSGSGTALDPYHFITTP